MKLSVLVIVGLAIGSTAGCVSPMQWTAKTRATNDLHCPEEQVVVQNIGGSSYRATGCNQEATYNCVQSSKDDFVCQREEQKAIEKAGAPAAGPPAH